MTKTLIKFWWRTSNFYSPGLTIVYIFYERVKWCPKKRYDFDKISPGWTKFTVIDWVVNKNTCTVKTTRSLAISCFVEDVLTEEENKDFILLLGSSLLTATM